MSDTTTVVRMTSNRPRDRVYSMRPTIRIEDHPLAESRLIGPTRTIPAYRFKPVMDVALASIIAVLVWPVMLAAMVLVRLTSQGSALYSQTRVGYGGRIFTIYKIRTMYQNCEAHTGPQWSTRGDRRITRIGRVLRALHIDELPQLWNVLRGDMSLIGPRPERPEIVENLRISIHGYDSRHAVKPGITGYAQIHLPPDSNIQTVRNKLVYDRLYITRMSFGMDAYILFATVLKVLGLRRLYRRPEPVELMESPASRAA